MIKGLQDAAERTRDEGKVEGFAKGKVVGRKEMEEEMATRLEERYNQGYWQVEEDVAEQILEAQAEIKTVQHNESFVLSYNKDLDEAGVGPKDRRRAIIEVPPLATAEAGAEAPNASAPKQPRIKF